VLLKVRAVELRNGVLDLFGPKLPALAVSAAYPNAVGRVSDDELTDADFWRAVVLCCWRGGVLVPAFFHAAGERAGVIGGQGGT
jgi:hypothetical protein